MVAMSMNCDEKRKVSTQICCREHLLASPAHEGWHMRGDSSWSQGSWACWLHSELHMRPLRGPSFLAICIPTSVQECIPLYMGTP